MAQSQTESVQDRPEFYPGNFILSNVGSRERVHYLDHAGATLFSDAQLGEAQAAISSLCINPHSAARASESDSVEHARRKVLQFVNAPPGQYTCIFTAGATSSLNLLANSFRWTREWQLCHTVSNHTSVLAMRSVAHERGASVKAVRAYRQGTSCVLGTPDEAANVSDDGLHGSEDAYSASAESTTVMLALPLECNMTGVRCSDTTLDALCEGRVIVPHICRNSKQKVLILLDAAKACQTHPPDLMRHACHFVVLSFYKIFGYPTGLGALLVRSDVLDLLQPPFLGGGSVMHVLPRTWPMHAAPRSAPASFEAGTLHYQGIAALPAGFAAWRRQAVDRGGASHACDLAYHLAVTLHSLKHSNGRVLCSVLSFKAHQQLLRTSSETLSAEESCAVQGSAKHLYPGHLGIGDSHEEPCHGSHGSDALSVTEMPAHGPVVAFVVWDMHGEPVSSYTVRDFLAEQQVYVRAGCCCNPGACATVLGFTDADMLQNVEEGWSCRGDVGVVHGHHTGIVRASLGIMSSQEDVDALVRVLVACFADQGDPVDVPDREKGLSEPTHTVLRTTDAYVDTELTCADDAELSAHEAHIKVGQHPGLDAASCSTGLQADLAHEQNIVCAVSSIYLYPVKSLAGVSVPSWPVSASGLLLDRSWAMMDRTGCILSCARYPRLQLLRASVCIQKHMLFLSWQGPAVDKTAVDATAVKPHASVIGVEWPSCMQSCIQGTSTSFPDSFWATEFPEEEIIHVSVQAANQWISELVGIECFLVHRCCYTGNTIGNSECVSNSEAQNAAPQEVVSLLGRVQVGAKCTCWPRTNVARPSEASGHATSLAPSNSSIEPREEFQRSMSTTEQQSSARLASDSVGPAREAMPGGFSNQAPMLLATLGSVCMAAYFLKSGRVSESTASSTEALQSPSTQHADCSVCFSGNKESCTVSVQQTGTEHINLSKSVFNEVVQRFRANLILSGSRPNAEADWQSVCIDMSPQSSTSVQKVSNHEQGSVMPPLRFAVGEQAVRCRAINVVAATGAVDETNGGLFRYLRRACGPGKVVWGVYVWPQHQEI